MRGGSGSSSDEEVSPRRPHQMRQRTPSEPSRDERSSSEDEGRGRGRRRRSSTPSEGRQLVSAPLAPPDLNDAVSRIRVDLPSVELDKFRGFAKGSAPSTRDRDMWMESLPIVNDVSSTAPRLDKSLRGKSNMKVTMSERQAIELHDGLYAALNLITLSNTQSVRGTEEELKYRDRALRVLSLLIHDVTVLRRESALVSVNVPQAVVPGIRKRTLDLIAENHPSVDNEMIHNLFASDMLADVKKAIKKQEKDKKESTRARGGRTREGVGAQGLRAR
uniref:Uncharacterized protein n=1 Tax=Panagrolaimus sp. JU765 TaxID=591449 RepID=A0AC34QKE1_9BILA